VVAVEVRERDRVDLQGIDAHLLQAGQRGRPAVEQQGSARLAHQDRAVAASAAPERVAGADEDDVRHRARLAAVRDRARE